VLILREGDIFPGEDCSDTHLSLRILVPLDGTEQAKVALSPAAQLLEALSGPRQKAEIHLATVIAPCHTKEKEREELME
jgi:nucleotide-binding universal stress UspA family protein